MLLALLQSSLWCAGHFLPLVKVPHSFYLPKKKSCCSLVVHASCFLTVYIIRGDTSYWNPMNIQLCKPSLLAVQQLSTSEQWTLVLLVLKGDECGRGLHTISILVVPNYGASLVLFFSNLESWKIRGQEAVVDLGMPLFIRLWHIIYCDCSFLFWQGSILTLTDSLVKSSFKFLRIFCSFL